jgi:hypothetical protein
MDGVDAVGHLGNSCYHVHHEAVLNESSEISNEISTGYVKKLPFEYFDVFQTFRILDPIFLIFFEFPSLLYAKRLEID